MKTHTYIEISEQELKQIILEYVNSNTLNTTYESVKDIKFLNGSREQDLLFSHINLKVIGAKPKSNTELKKN